MHKKRRTNRQVSTNQEFSWLWTLAQTRVGTWLLEEVVGNGKIGIVYRAVSTQVPDWTTAVKIFFKEPLPGWQNELQKVSRLALVSGVVPFHGVDSEVIINQGISKTVWFTVWEYISPGMSLKDYLKNTESCSASFLVAVLETILGVLHGCKAKGVERHGDLHPGNILVGRPDEAYLNQELEVRTPIYVTDFGYGTTGAIKQPKDDYAGLAEIASSILLKVDWARANASDRRIITGISALQGKLLKERSEWDKQPPLAILRLIRDLKEEARLSAYSRPAQQSLRRANANHDLESMRVGQFQVAEMLEDKWELWKRLFVPSVPARSKLLESDITTVVTGPRGCGKTMLFRRLSERLMLECGPIDGEAPGRFTGFYINANDIGDAFPAFPLDPSPHEAELAVCYANICILSEFLAVESARCRLHGTPSPPGLLVGLREWIGTDPAVLSIVANEDELERHRHTLETIKWKFPRRNEEIEFPGRLDLCRHDWIKMFIAFLRKHCDWLNRTVYFFIDDFSLPRVSIGLQKSLNRLFFQRGSDFVLKIATEAATTFLPQDYSGKLLQDGDDYQLIDMAGESLFMQDTERVAFLSAVFEKRLSLDSRIPSERHTLYSLLGLLGMKKTEFARLLRGEKEDVPIAKQQIREARDRKGAAKGRALYSGHDVFCALWSGDTRIMIQLVQELVDEALREDGLGQAIRVELQDRVFRNRGGDWLEMQVRNQPTNIRAVDSFVSRRQGFRFNGGSYGAHLKAVVEAFKEAARHLLLGPTYKIVNSKTGKIREVPRMAFRIEVTDKFRLDDLEAEIYKDLIRYGLFLRDNRGKSIQGAMVPRLYLRRLLLPYCVLALSKRDSVPLTCAWFRRLLIEPDLFAREWPGFREIHQEPAPGQMVIEGIRSPAAAADPQYDDLSSEEIEEE